MKITIFYIKIDGIDFFYLNKIFLFKSIFNFFKICIRFLHHSILSVITNVLPLSVSLWMTVIGLD